MAPAPADLLDRRVEITGPTEPKMAINALNSGPGFGWPIWRTRIRHIGRTSSPDSSSCVTPSAGELRYVSPDGQNYELRPDRELAVMVVRPRGWHFDEQHVMVDGVPGRSRVRRFRPALLPQRGGITATRLRPLLLPAEDGESP